MGILPPTSSEWERAKRELRGEAAGRGRSDPRVPMGLGMRPMTSSNGFAARVDGVARFDASRVERMKTISLRLLKNATHIRNLVPDDTVSITAFGSPIPGNVSYAEAFTPDGRVHRIKAPPASAGRTVLTIRTKKSDIDAFAKGDLSFEQFQERAEMATYTTTRPRAGYQPPLAIRVPPRAPYTPQSPYPHQAPPYLYRSPVPPLTPQPYQPQVPESRGIPVIPLK